MATDPLRALLRGCVGTSVKNYKSKWKQAPVAHPTSLPPVLDFFATGHIRPSTTTEAVPLTQKPVSAPASASLSQAVDDPVMEAALLSIGVTAPTAVQRRAIPAMRAGNDVIAVAPTGSGKTLAYLLPLLHHLRVNTRPTTPNTPRALILAPTRELATQIGRVCTRLVGEANLSLRLTVLASKVAAAGLKASALNGTVDIIIATPMRLVDAAAAASLQLGHIAHVVLDEADELLDDRFVGQLDTALAACGAQRRAATRVHMFSATLPPRVEELAVALQSSPRKIVVDGGAYGGAAAVGDVARAIDQKFTFVGGRGEQGKVFAVRALLKGQLKPPVLLFVQSRERAAELFRELVYDGVKVDAIHADRSQAARDSAVQRFRSGEVWVLIATDVLARGLDFLCVNSVVNYDMPASPMAYVHRIGRTGRNGRSGQAITLFTEEDRGMLRPILKVAKASGAEVPEWGLKVRAGRKDEIRRLETRPPMRKRVGGPNLAKLPKRHRKEGGIEKQRRRKGGKVRTEDGDGEGAGADSKQGRKKRKRGQGGEDVQLFNDDRKNSDVDGGGADESNENVGA